MVFVKCYLTEVYLGPCQISMMELFPKMLLAAKYFSKIIRHIYLIGRLNTPLYDNQYNS